MTHFLRHLRQENRVLGQAAVHRGEEPVPVQLLGVLVSDVPAVVHHGCEEE